MKMKKLLAWAVAAVMVSGMLAACSGEKAAETTAAETTKSEETTEATKSEETTEAPQSSQAGTYDLSQVEERKLVFGHTGAPGSANEFWAENLKAVVEEKSEGKITIDTYGASQLGSDVAIASDLQAGAVDLQVCSPAALVTVIPGGAIFDMPCLFDDVKMARAALANEDFFSAVAEGYDAVGLKLLTLYDQQFREVTSNKEIKSYDDLKGMSLRTMNNAHHIAFWSAMGAAPTPMDTADIFLALQQGMLDGQENPYGQIVDKGLFEVQKYVTNSNHIVYVGDVFMSKITWEKLSEVEKQLFTDAVAEVKAAAEEFVDQNESAALKKLTTEYGMTFIDFDQIEGMREKMREATWDVAYNSISGAIGNELLDQWIAAAGY